MTETKLVNAVSPTWDACIRIIPVAVGEHLKAVVFSPSGALIAAHGECCVEVFDAMTGVNRATFDGNKSICSIAFSPDDGFLVSGHWDGIINVWDVQTGTMSRTFKRNMRTSAHSAVFSSCGTMISSGGSDGTVQIWNILSGDDCVFQGHSRAVTDVCWLATRNQVVSASDFTVRIWDVRKQMCLKEFPSQYHDLVTTIASSRGLLLVASTFGTVNIYDSQSGDIIHVIRSNNNITHTRFSIDGGKVLVASRNSGDIWDITTNTLTRVRSVDYNGDHPIFSPDGTRVASIYGKFLKIWKTNSESGYNHHEVSTHMHNFNIIENIYISPDERLVTLKSNMGADILDATSGQCLFTIPVDDFLSIGISLDLAFVAFLLPHNEVQIWNSHTCHHKSIAIDNNVFYIALSPDGSQLASLSLSHMKLWDLKREGCLAHLQFDKPLRVQAQISFATGNATSVSVLKNSDGTQSWCIFPNHNIDLTRHSIKNSDGTKSWLISRPLKSHRRQHISPNYNIHLTGDPIMNSGITKLPMVFVPTTEERSNQDIPALCQSYRCDTDGEWILDQDGRRILWIPPDERPQQIWNCFKCEKKVLIQTEGGKVYFVNFS
jgi:WD40 repeat protein